MKDLQAYRTGARVQLNWTTPSKTTDDTDIKGPMTAEICREAGPRPQTPKQRQTACAPVRRLAVVSGPSEIWDDLPAQLVADPPLLLTYRIQTFNAAGRSAGNSAAAYAASGAAPPSISSLKATASPTGAILEWQRSAATGLVIDLKRIDLTVPNVAEKQKKAKPLASPAIGKKKPAPAAKTSHPPVPELHLRTPEAVQSSGLVGTMDQTAAMGDTYTYIAERVRTVTIGSHTLEIHSEPSPPATLAMRDTFPPRIPTGLATVPGQTSTSPVPEPYIDLSWEPNGETDLAGYFVYRQLARPNGDPQGPLARLTPLPITSPAYRDVAVKPGQRYIYSVTAVDASGNESAPSAKAQETASPDAGGSPN